jgi:hypothetical protein
MIHPFKAIQVAWSAFWSRASEGIRADRDGMQIESYQRDIERYVAFADLKKSKPKVVEALEKRSGRIIYDLIMLQPTSADFVNQLIHLHGQASILIKDILTEIINAETYLTITEKELRRVQEEKSKRTRPMTPNR